MTDFSHAAVCFPDMARHHHAWIGAIRDRYDPRASLIGAHVTIVFPQTIMQPDAFESWIGELAGMTTGISIRFTEAKVVRDPVTGRFLLYLLPGTAGTGRDAVNALHDRAYSGDLASSLRDDGHYEPHMTLGSFENEERAHFIADDLNERTIEIDVGLNGIQLVQVDGDSIRKGAYFPFSKAND